MRKSQLEKLKDARKRYEDQVQMSLDDLFKLLVDGSRKPEERRINPTQYAFAMSPERIVAYMGPAGCAKTSTLAAKGFLRSLLQPGSKGFVGRHDYNDLHLTTKLRFEEMLGNLPKGILIDRSKAPPEKWFVRPIPMPGPDGEVDDRPSQISFMGMKDPLIGFEINWAVVDEANEVDEKRIHELSHRLRAPGGNYSISLAFNPPDKDHWLYVACTGRNFKDQFIREPWIILHTPRPDENVRNLPPGYYDELAKNLPEDLKDRYIKGLWGSTFPGMPVYRQFRQAHHVKPALEWDGHSTMMRFWDFGYRHPVCIWCYVDWAGRLKVLCSEQGENIEARPWAQRCKAWSKERFPDAENWLDFGDPAIKQKKDTGSALQDFAAEGIQMRYRTLKINIGLRWVRQRLELMIDGEPAIQIKDGTNHILVSALRGGYHLDETGQEPVKDGYYDHMADAFRYGITNVFPGSDLPAIVQHIGGDGLPANLAYRED